MKPHELRSLTDGELLSKLDEAHEELLNLRFSIAIGQQRDTNRKLAVERDVARIKTILRERQLAAEIE